MDGSYSLADYRAATENNGWGDGLSAGIGGFVGSILGNGGFGLGGFGNNRGNVATTEDLASGFNFSSLQGKTNDILAAVNGVNQNIGNAVCTSTYELASKIDGCCCETNRNIDSVRYENAMNTAAINANTTAGIQKILDKMCQDQMSAMQNQINQLQLQSALCGVPKINPYGYGIYAYPTCANI